MKRDIVERFFSHVEKTETCWLWTGSRSPEGYGFFGAGSRIDGTFRIVRPHRWLFEYCNGPIPGGLHLDHLCRNPSCVNPRHLEPVTPRENTLRGEGACARHARQTHCVHGHEFTEANTYIRLDGGRTCRACRRRIDRRRGPARWAAKKLIHCAHLAPATQ